MKVGKVHIKIITENPSPLSTTTSSFWNNVVQFLQRTSLRGVPQIIKAKKLHFKVLWTCITIFLFIGCGINLYIIIKQYFAYDVVQVRHLLHKPKAQFPSITVCNQQAISHQGYLHLQKLQVATPKQFWNNILQQVKHSSGDHNSTDIIHEQIMRFNTMSSYLANVPKYVKPRQLGNSLRGLVNNCKIRLLQASSDVPYLTTNCSQVGAWRHINDYNKINCFMFSLFDNLTLPVLDVEIRLFLDNHLDSECYDCSSFDITTQITGARVVIHEKNTYPDIHNDGFNISPATYTQVELKTRQWTRTPYGKCSAQIPRQIFVNGLSFKYDYNTCKRLLQHQQIVDHCRCRYTVLPSTSSPNDELAMEKCESIGGLVNFNYTNVLMALKKIDCASKLLIESLVRSHKHNKQIETCQRPCKHFKFDLFTMSSQWPRKSHHVNFVKHLFNEAHSTFIQDKYRSIDNLIKHGNYEEALELLDKVTFVESSFLLLKVWKKDFQVTEVHEKLVSTPSILMGQIGGLFSMWIGFTILWFAELLEFFVISCRTRIK